jgi:hypothetical protein
VPKILATTSASGTDSKPTPTARSTPIPSAAQPVISHRNLCTDDEHDQCEPDISQEGEGLVVGLQVTAASRPQHDPGGQLPQDDRQMPAPRPREQRANDRHQRDHRQCRETHPEHLPGVGPNNQTRPPRIDRRDPLVAGAVRQHGDGRPPPAGVSGHYVSQTGPASAAAGNPHGIVQGPGQGRSRCCRRVDRGMAAGVAVPLWPMGKRA